MSRKLISVIIPSYNRADTVGQTIDSIISQVVDADVEVVVGDDCSTDNVRGVLEQYQKKYPDVIRLFFREQNMGLGANWAQCVKDCRGDYICNCDNDDYWHNPQKLQLQLDYMESHPSCNICITDHRTHNRATGKVRECKANLKQGGDVQQYMWNSWNFCNATIMYRADFMKTHLDLDEFIRRRLSLQDWPALVILTAYTDVDVLPVSTATFCIETVSITRPDSVEHLAKRYRDDKEVYRYLCELFPDKFPYDETHWNRYVNSRLLSKAFDLGQYSLAKQYSRDCENVEPLKRLFLQNQLLFEMYVWLRKVLTRRIL